MLCPENAAMLLLNSPQRHVFVVNSIPFLGTSYMEKPAPGKRVALPAESTLASLHTDEKKKSTPLPEPTALVHALIRDRTVGKRGRQNVCA